MLEDTRHQQWFKFLLGIFFPTLMAITISIGSIYVVIIPSFQESFMESKRGMLRELTNVAWSVLVMYREEELAGRLSREEAQRKALAEIEHLHYGEENKDYFWVNDMHPRLIMHPYSKELIGSDLSEYEAPGGKRLFMEIKAAVADRDSAFIDYMWNKKYGTEKNVPKLSYVKKFEPWGWVVGTGVFLDDVEIKTEQITDRLSVMSFSAAAVITLLLLYVTHHSLTIERKRRAAEHDLRRSRQKYKTLVETAVDPIMMIFEGKCIYANASMERLLGYSAAELESLDLFELFPENSEGTETSTLQQYFSASWKGVPAAGEYEVVLQRKDGHLVNSVIVASQKNLGKQNVTVMSAKDMSGIRKIKEQLGESRERYRLLTNQLNIGVFRTTAENKLRFVEANPATLQLLGIADEAELLGTYLLDVLEMDNGFTALKDTLQNDGYVKEQVFRLKKRNGTISVVSISMVQTRDSGGQALYCDGIIADVSEQKKREQDRENLIVELQTSLLFLNQPIRNSLNDCLVCELSTSVRAAAELMSKANRNAILVSSGADSMIGIVTDGILRERVIADNLSCDTPVYEIMNSPLIYINDTALLFEAVLLCQERGARHLVVKDIAGKIVGVISNEELMDVHRYSAAFMINEIRNAGSVDEIQRSHERIARVVKALTDSGAHAKNITRVITNVSDTILEKIIDLVIEEIGEPPARFAFISLGSEGREEQTLATDQDNALIFEDVSEEEYAAVHAYFLEFSTKVCTWLDQVGYDFCKGNVMAMNPQWCQPVRVWKEYFTRWITESSPEDLMEVSIFFDFRCLYGDRRFADELRDFIKAKAENKVPFFYQLAQNTLLFKIPVDFFGNISVDSGGEHPNTFNIKHVLALIVGFARIYAINCSLESTNTLQRIDLLLQKNVLTREIHEEIVEAYNYLMQLRFKHQVWRIDSGEPPDNFVNINTLTHMERDMLEKIFSQVGRLRKRLSLVGQNEIFF